MNPVADRSSLYCMLFLRFEIVLFIAFWFMVFSRYHVHCSASTDYEISKMSIWSNKSTTEQLIIGSQSQREAAACYLLKDKFFAL
ncbi:hypothetical protein L6452_03623 [Arctium lappa]|uniref:Uncharacterized protein n=1 Tax=Arctium lappa TaxID=4217 RepID=A0ACB9FPE4_ARCLA|nr:hypothetical protein L6452_03623 [Arctium lappa]